MERSTVADAVIEHLTRNTDPEGYTPMEIAIGTGLNANTVRRVTKELAVSGEIVEATRAGRAPSYALPGNVVVPEQLATLPEASILYR